MKTIRVLHVARITVTLEGYQMLLDGTGGKVLVYLTPEDLRNLLRAYKQALAADPNTSD